MSSRRIDITQFTANTALKFTLTDEDGAPIDLTGLTVKFLMKDKTAAASASPKIDSACALSGTGIDPVQGQCKYTFASDGTDTDTTGDYYGQVEVVDSNTTYYTERDAINIRIVERLRPSA
ncbi:MAG: BppU family phage baseplate upper protein [Armatimonadota bacterium]|jgi:hypothetical protein